MSFVVSVTSPNRKRAFAVEISIPMSCDGSSSSFCTSLTALRGTMTPGMPVEPSGAGVSTRASLCPSVATARSIGMAPTSTVWR